MIVNIRATNSINEVFVFDNVNRLVNGLDLSGIGADVNFTESSLGGSRYQNTRLRNRQLNLEIQLRKNMQSEELSDIARQRVYEVFNPELNPIRFDFQTTNGDEYYLNSYLQAAPLMPPDSQNDNVAFQSMLVQLVCLDPYIYQSQQSRVEISTFGESGFKFDLQIPEEGIHFETRSQNLFGIVEYNGNGQTGMSIRFLARSAVVNPSLINVNTREMIKLNYSMQTGDVITIDTYRGERSIRLQRGRENINIFNSYSLTESTFLQLSPGTNIFRADADSGQQFLETSIEYRVRRIGL